MAFNHFDKDQSGFIEGREILNAVEKVSKALGLKTSPAPAVNTVFDKVAGPDGKLDKAEFKNMLQMMFKMAEEEARKALDKAKAAAGTAVSQAQAKLNQSAAPAGAGLTSA